jgi:hypothetical protein
MEYKPGTILVVDFGDHVGKSIAQLPLVDYKDGYRFIANLSKSPKMKDGISYDPKFQTYISEVVYAFREFPIKIKCEGAHGWDCKRIAGNLVMTYDRIANHPEKIGKDNHGPKWIKQLNMNDSYFCCENCGQVRKKDKTNCRETEESGTVELPISFRLPYFLIGEDRVNYNIDRKELHHKLRKLAYQLKDKGIDDVIDPRNILRPNDDNGEEPRIIFTKEIAQEITSKLLQKRLNLTAEYLDCIMEAGFETEYLRQINDFEHAYKAKKAKELQRHKLIPGQPALFAH